MKKTTRMLLAALAGASLALSGCAAAQTPNADGDSSSAGDGKIALLNVFPQLQFVAAQQEFIVERAQELGYEVQVMSVGPADPQAEVANLEAAAARGDFDAYIVLPEGGGSLLPAMTKLVKTGKPVVITSIAAGNDLCTTDPAVEGLTGQVSLPACEIGDAMADATVEACEGIDNCNVIAAVGIVGFPAEAELLKSLDAAMEDIGASVLKTSPTNYDIATSASVLQTTLASNPDADALVLSNPNMYAGFERAFPEGIDGLKVIVNAATPEHIEALKAGKVFAIFTPNGLPQTDGELALQMAIAAIEDPSKVGEWNLVDSAAEIGLPRYLTAANEAEWRDFTPEFSIR